MELYGFITYLKEEKKDFRQYLRGLRAGYQGFAEFLRQRGTEDLALASGRDAASYMLELKNSESPRRR